MAQISLSNAHFAFLNQGAITQKIEIAGRNIVLSFPTADAYLTAPYFGETIGRVANRIQDGNIRNLNGRSYQLEKNERNLNHHHGGIDGWGHKDFKGPEKASRGGKETLVFRYISPDGDEGYPGTVELRVYYSAYEMLENGIKKNVLEVEYEAELVGNECAETVINITNHSYFNISDGSTIEGTEVSLSTDQHLEVDVNAIPTGSIQSFADLVADKPFTLGAKEPRIDHCFVVDDQFVDLSIDTRAREPKCLVKAFHHATQIHLEVHSTEPSFQFYTGDFNNVAALDDLPARGPRSGFCVEPGRFINAINVPAWRSQVLLVHGQKYGSRSLYRFWQH